MAGLQRSAVSFRRQGSSGLVWDDKVITGELNKLADQHREEKNSKPEKRSKDDASAEKKSPRPVELRIDRSRSNGGRGYRAGRVTPEIEPPSPKVSACGFCHAFGKTDRTHCRPRKSAKRVK